MITYSSQKYYNNFFVCVCVCVEEPELLIHTHKSENIENASIKIEREKWREK